MPEKLSFALFSPNGILGQSDACVQVSLPGKSGELVLMPSAMPCLVVLRRGFIVVEHAGGEEKKYYTSGGVCQVSHNGKRVSVFSEEAVDACNDKALEECMKKIRSEPILLSEPGTFFLKKLH